MGSRKTDEIIGMNQFIKMTTLSFESLEQHWLNNTLPSLFVAVPQEEIILNEFENESVCIIWLPTLLPIAVLM